MRTQSDLPALVEDYLQRVVPESAGACRQVLLTQVGEMVMRPGARPMRFTAVERLATDRVAFAWEARFRIAPGVSLRVRDGYDQGRGALTVSALGVPLQRESGRSIDLGEAYRYLAELAWVPQALALNPDLCWRETGSHTVEVSAAVGEDRATMELTLDPAGDIVQSCAAERPGRIGGRAIRMAWGGTFSDYRTLSAIRLPSHSEVYWDLPEGRFTYWRGQVTSAEALDVPFAPRDRGQTLVAP